MHRLLTILVVAMATAAKAQVPQTHLAPANGTLDEHFRRQSLNRSLDAPRTFHELHDGRVLLLDGLRVLLADFTTGRAEVLSDLRSGTLLPLAGDSSIIAQPSGWVFLNGTRTVGMLPLDNPVVQGAGYASNVVGVDNRGHLLSRLSLRRGSDSASILRIDRESGAQDTVVRLWFAPPWPQGIFRPICADLHEQAELAPDGWLAVVRLNPYRVDWLSPSGTWTLGKPIPTPVVPFTDAEKRVYLDWRERERPTLPQDSVVSWPDTVCPWVAGYAPLPTPDGKLLVYRVPTTAAPATRYDVINRNGIVERQLVLDPSESIMGFGPHSVYVAKTVESAQVIQRHPWP